MDNKLTLPDVFPFARAYLQKPENIVGGSLHAFFEDGNIDDGSILYCRDYAVQRADTDGAALCGLLLRLSKTQRGKLINSVRTGDAARMNETK